MIDASIHESSIRFGKVSITTASQKNQEIVLCWDLGPSDCEVTAPSSVFAIGAETY
jgi:hypothetical protein